MAILTLYEFMSFEANVMQKIYIVYLPWDLLVDKWDFELQKKDPDEKPAMSVRMNFNKRIENTSGNENVNANL